MISLVQPIAAVLLGILAAYGAGLYEPLYDPDANLGNFPLWAAGCGVFVGWRFLGRSVGQKLWLSAFMGVRAIVMTAVLLAVLMGGQQMFVLGYRRRYDNLVETFQGFFDNLYIWFAKALDQEFLITMGVSSAVLGIVLHIFARVFEARRNAR